MTSREPQADASASGSSPLQLIGESDHAAGPARRCWSGAADPAIVAHARRAVADFASGHVSETRLADVRLCVSEAVTNAVAHGFTDGRSPGVVTISTSIERDALVIVVADNGQGLRADSANSGLGLGLPLIAALADDSSVATGPDGGMQVSMRFDSRRRVRDL